MAFLNFGSALAAVQVILLKSAPLRSAPVKSLALAWAIPLRLRRLAPRNDACVNAHPERSAPSRFALVKFVPTQPTQSEPSPELSFDSTAPRKSAPVKSAYERYPLMILALRKSAPGNFASVKLQLSSVAF